MFEHSLELVDDCGLTRLHVFPFSARPGTPAARMPQLDRGVVKERAQKLRARGALALRRHLDAEVGRERAVLVESGSQGRTEQFTQVLLAQPANPGAIVVLRIAGHDGRQLLAAWTALIPPPARRLRRSSRIQTKCRAYASAPARPRGSARDSCRVARRFHGRADAGSDRRSAVRSRMVSDSVKGSSSGNQRFRTVRA